MAAPASATAPPLVPTRPAVGSLRRGLAIPRPAVIPTHFVVGIHGWAPGGLASRHTSWSGRARLRLGRCPRRKDRRGSCRHGGILRGGFSRALLAACGGSALRASGGGARGDAVRGRIRREPNPASDPRSSRHALRSGLTYARRTNPPRTADLRWRLSVRAFQAHFSFKIGRFGAQNGPRDSILPEKRPPKALQGRRQLVPRLFAARKTRDHLLSAACLPGADSGPRLSPSRPRRRVRDWGRAVGLRGRISQSSKNN